MKKLTLSVLALATVASFTACKKGENDPTLSLKSRKVRLAGEWTVAAEMTDKTTITTNTSGATTSTSNTTSDGATFTEKYSQTGSFAYSTVTNGTVTSSTYSIKKDGTWSSKEVIKENSSTTTTSAGTSPVQSLNIVTTTEKSGTWQFTGKNKGIDEKKKESVIFSTTKVSIIKADTDANGKVDTDVNTMTYGTNEKVSVWHLTELKSKELVADAKIESISDGSQSNNGGTPVPNTKYDTKGSYTITLKQ